MKIPNVFRWKRLFELSLARIVSEDSQLFLVVMSRAGKSSKDS